MKDRNVQTTIIQDGERFAVTPLRRKGRGQIVLGANDDRHEETTAEFWEHYFDEQKESSGGVVLFLSVLSGPFVYFLCKALNGGFAGGMDGIVLLAFFAIGFELTWLGYGLWCLIQKGLSEAK